jgi:hypothetical protein
MVGEAIRSMTYAENFMNKDGEIYDNISMSCDLFVTQMESIIRGSKDTNAASNIALFCLGISSKMVVNEMLDLRRTFEFSDKPVDVSIIYKLIDKVVEYHTDLGKDLSTLIYDDICSTSR